MARRSKPRVNHVRTGCLTCKRRKVKCPEEKPYCSRCIRGDFVCEGYAVPKAWVFEGSAPRAQSRTEVNRTRPGTSKDSAFVGARTLAVLSRSGIWKPHLALLHSSIQLGNSDPFYSYAIPIGPRENHLLAVYQELISPHICGTSHRKPINIGAVYLECLEDEAAACALFARNSALQGVALRGRHAKPSASSLAYANRSYAVLRHRLSLMDGSETAATVLPMIRSTCLLAAAGMFTDFTTAEVHLRAMSKLVVRYAELMGGKPDKEPALITAYVDMIRAYAALPRPTVDIHGWFERLFQDMQDFTIVSQKDAQASYPDPTAVHADVEDKTLSDTFVNLSEGMSGHRGSSQAEGSVLEEAELCKPAGLSQPVFQHSLLLGVVQDALEQLKSSGMKSEEAQHLSVRVYLAIPLILWIQITSPTAVFTDILFNLTPSLLRQVKGMIKRDIRIRNAQMGRDEAYTNAQLWALVVGNLTQVHKKEILGSDLVCEGCLSTLQQNTVART